MRKITICIVCLLVTCGVFSSPMDQKSLWREFQEREGGTWRTTLTKEGRIKSLFGSAAHKRSGGTPASIAAEVIRQYASLFGIDYPDELKLEQLEESQIGRHFRYRQYLSGLPVDSSEIHLHFDHQNRLIAASSSVQSGLKPESGAIVQIKDPNARLVLLPLGGKARMVWKTLTHPQNLTEGARILYLDAQNPNKILRVHNAFAIADGLGTVFQENPVTTPEATQESFKYMDGSKSLSGKFVRTYNANFTLSTDQSVDLSEFTTANDSRRQYHYDQTDPRFTEAMAYYHINIVHDQWRSFGFNKLNIRFPVFVNVRSRNGGGFDNAFYSRTPRFRSGMIVMGDGNILENFGHDADIYYHEYGHAVLDRIKPELFESVEHNYPFAFHEGFGDISAAATTGNSKLGEFALRRKDNKQFTGRNLENRNSYPKDVIYPPFNRSEAHHTGLIFGGVWWDLQKVIGRTQAQKLLYLSLPMLPRDMTFFSFRDSMLVADNTLNRGANQKAILESFEDHGISGSDPGQPGTIRVNALKTAKLIPANGKFQIKTEFKKGDLIFVLASYNGSNLTPGYNLIIEEFSVTTPDAPTNNITFIPQSDEVRNGNRSGGNGANQAIILTFSDTVSGTYSMTVRSRLGGTSQFTTAKSVRFRIVD